MQTHTPKRAPKRSKGTVAVEEFQGRLRLRWRYRDKRYVLTIGLPDSKINRQVAQHKATIIELDMASGNFDLSLKKYKPETQSYSKTSVVHLFEKFIKYKSKGVVPRSLEKYKATLSYLASFFPTQSASTIEVTDAEKFSEWLRSQQLTPIVCRERLILVKAAWQWAVKNNLVEANPWIEIVSRVKVPPKQMPKPFTRDEITAIVQAFRTDKYYHYYGDYVEFLFSTGCRTAEAIGLRWKHLNDDCSCVWFGESLTRGVRKSTKTNRARTVTLTPKLQQMLLARRLANPDPEELVFTASEGGSIDDNNFRNRAWEPILNHLNIKYRKPYITRHTFISHALDRGMNPVDVAAMTGHDVQTLYENYAGSVSSRLRLPEL